MTRPRPERQQTGLEALRRQGIRILPALLEEEVTTTYAGSALQRSTPTTRWRSTSSERYVCVGGIRLTGLTASLALAEHVAGLVVEAGVDDRGPLARSTPPVDAQPW